MPSDWQALRAAPGWTEREERQMDYDCEHFGGRSCISLVVGEVAGISPCIMIPRLPQIMRSGLFECSATLPSRSWSNPEGPLCSPHRGRATTLDLGRRKELDQKLSRVLTSC